MLSKFEKIVERYGNSTITEFATSVGFEMFLVRRNIIEMEQRNSTQ